MEQPINYSEELVKFTLSQKVSDKFTKEEALSSLGSRAEEYFEYMLQEGVIVKVGKAYKLK